MSFLRRSFALLAFVALALSAVAQTPTRNVSANPGTGALIWPTGATFVSANSLITASTVNGYFADPSTNGSFSASAWRTDLSVLTAAEIAAAYQPLDADLTAIAALTTTSFGRSFLDRADAAAARTLMGVVIGTDVQAYDADLAAIAGLTSAADKLPYFTGSGTATLADFTAGGRALVNSAGTADTFPYFSASNTVTLGSITTAGRNLLDDASASAQRTTLGLGSADSPTFTALTLTGNLNTSDGFTVASAGSIALTAAGTNENITLTPSGTGDVIINGAGTTGQNLLLGTTTDSSNGKLQLATHTTAAGGIGFGTDVTLYRSAADTLKTDDSLVVASTVASTSTTSGSATFGGGIGVAGAVYSGVGLYGRRTAGDLALDLRTTTSGVAILNLFGFGTQTSVNTAANNGATITLQNQDATPGTFTSIGSNDASGSAVAKIAFVAIDDATNEGRISIMSRPAGGNLTEWLTLSGAGTLNSVATTEATTGGTGSLTTAGGIYAAKKVVSSGDFEAADIGEGFIVKSPNGTRWRITVDNAGAITTTAL